ncbi:uncharacterized protein LOC131658597 [Vicia villosa]|uniref:uncharacterized protein LOC131658597 n=1 Tax=Vicia villosa TaxID=3911 RepID=UPI00273BF708|nr:uncharacterized protein LOC131658597 [Vicia villosa]
MNGVTTVTYRYNINGENSQMLRAARGIRQRDPISPYLFVIVMEYMSRLLHQMQLDPDFHHHSRCKKLGLTHLTFADDVLLFARGDTTSVQKMKHTLHCFSDSAGLSVNPMKCYVYMGAMEEGARQQIMEIIGFREGTLPFRYLGVPLTCKRLSAAHYLPLIEKILQRLQHWSTRFLSKAGRIQLVQSVSFAIANYWLQCLPLSKCVIQKIQTAYRIFVWTRGTTPSRKSPVAWKKICKPRAKRGYNVIDVEGWNKITMMKLLWDLKMKSDCLWVRWIHSYFIKGQDLLHVEIPTSASWVYKGVLNTRAHIVVIQEQWDRSLLAKKFHMSKM